MYDDTGLMCCALEEFSGFAEDGENDYLQELRDADRDTVKEFGKNPAIACVNSDQLKAKKMLEDAGFFVAAVLKSNEDGRPIYFMARGIKFKNPPRKQVKKSPRRKRG